MRMEPSPYHYQVLWSSTNVPNQAVVRWSGSRERSVRLEGKSASSRSGLQGVVAFFTTRLLKELGIRRQAQQKVIKELSTVAENSSH